MTRNIFLFGFLILLVFSCTKDKKNTEKALLAKYLEEHNIKEDPQGSGLYVLETGFSTHQTGQLSPEAGDTVVLIYKGYLLADPKVVFDERTLEKPLKYVYLKDAVIPGWEEAIGLMKKNTPALIIIPSKLAYKGKHTGMIPPYSTLIFEARIIDIIKPTSTF